MQYSPIGLMWSSSFMFIILTMKNSLLEISRNIKKLKKNMTMRQLAEKAGISVNTLYKVIYVQKDDIQLSTLMAIAKALNTSLDILVGYKK